MEPSPVTERRRPNRAAQSAADQRRARRAAAAARASTVSSKRPWWQNPRVLIVALAAIGLGALVAMSFVSRATAKTYSCDAQVPEPVGGMPSEGIEQEARGNRHVANGSVIDYPVCPPTSGDHYPSPGGPIRPAFYGPGQMASPGGWVHNLEHGFIVVLYRGELDEAGRQSLQRYFDAFPQPSPAGCTYRKLVIARFDEMATPFAVLAWQHLLLLPEWDESKAVSFATRWLENTPSPEARVC